MNDELNEKISRVSHNDQIIDSSDILLSPGFAEGCTIFGRVNCQ